MTEVRGRVVLITGASSGIGAATARAFAQAGARVALVARRADRLAALERALGPAAYALPVDLAQPDGPAQVVAGTLDRFGRIDVLFNNAGFGRLGWLDDLSADEVESQVRVNLIAAIELTRLALPDMLARGRAGERPAGHILNMASLAGLIGSPTYSVYGAAKAALRRFSEALRREVAPFGVQVSVISPGGVAATEFAERAGIQRRTRITTPGWLQPSADDVARAVVELARRPRREVVFPWPLGALAWINQHFPSLTDWLVVNAFTQRERPHPRPHFPPRPDGSLLSRDSADGEGGGDGSGG